MTSASDVVAIDLPARLWSVVDGQIDNTVSLALVDGVEAVVETGGAIREAGWAQVPWTENRDWPPMDQAITISLTREQWSFALAELRRSIPRYEELAAEFPPDRAGPYVEAVELGRQAIEVIDFNLS